MIALKESAALAEALIAETVAKQAIEPGTLTLHADRGTSMRSKPVAALLVDLDVAKSHSRPHVSDDNPYSEAQFKTLKYRRDFPERFGSIEDTRAHCQDFFTCYNGVHRHSGIGYMTPAVVHYGHAAAIFQQRAATRDAAFCAHPQRFKGNAPRPPKLPIAVWINPPPATPATPPLGTRKLFPKQAQQSSSSGSDRIERARSDRFGVPKGKVSPELPRTKTIQKLTTTQPSTLN